MPFIVKIARVVAAFVEGIFAAINNGARHPVAAYGGGIKGAWKLAGHEWQRSTTLQELPSPGYEDIDKANNEKKNNEAYKKELNPVSRYLPVSAGALGVKRS